MKFDRPYLLHIKDYLGKIGAARAKGREALCADPMLDGMVTLNLVRIGECTAKLSPELRAAAPVDWEMIFSLRDLADPDDPRRDPAILWNLINGNLRELEAFVLEKTTETDTSTLFPAARTALPGFIRQKRDDLYRAAGKHGISNIRVFGSFARGEEKPDSDLDILVHFDATRTGSGLSFLEFRDEAEKILNKKIDIVLDGGLSPHIGPYILREAVAL